MIAPRQRPRRNGFTLVELLVVLAVMAIVAAITIPTISSVLRSYNLKSTAQGLIGQLNYARQTAVAGNQAVEVRIYQLPDPVFPSASTLRAVQAFQVGAPTSGTTPTYAPVSKPYIFPPGIIISANTAAASTLLNSTFGITALVSPPVDITHPLPPPYGVVPYYAFRYRATGQTDLTPSTTSANGKPLSPTLTLYSESQPTVANGLPANFITVEIDVINGTVRSYQP